MEMIEVKTAELIGPALDWAVLFAGYGDGPDWRLIDGGLYIIGLVDIRVGMDGIGQQEIIDPFQPSTRWKDGGPLVEKFILDLKFCVFELPNETWKAETHESWANGSTALIASMRAIVHANFGDTVSVPRELMQ